MSIKTTVKEIYPLSPMQQGMVVHSLREPEAGLYIEQSVWEIEGEIDPEKFTAAWQLAIKRHPVLRTAISWKQMSGVFQVVFDMVDIPIDVSDLRGLSSAKQQHHLEAYLEEDRRRGFDLSHAPLARLALFRIDDRYYIFIFTLHHALLDGWSCVLVLKEVMTFYEALCRKRDLRLPEPRPFWDYLSWLEEQDMAEAEAYWRRKLKHFGEPTPLPTGGGTQGRGQGEQNLRLSQTTTSALQRAAVRHRLTLNTILQGAWAVLLSRYSGETDVVFGATVSGRPGNLPGVESMVGLFINTLPVRARVDRRQQLTSWLKQLQQEQAEARQYEYAPLVEIQRWSEVPPGAPLFDSIVVFENYAVGAFEHYYKDELAPDPTESALFCVVKFRFIDRVNCEFTPLSGVSDTIPLKLTYDSASSVMRQSGDLL